MNEIFLRRSIRSFSNEEVNEDIILDMINAAMQAPSARNQQPWNFVIVRDKANIQKLANATPSARSIAKANVVVGFVAKMIELTSPKYLEQDMAACVENFMIEGVTHQVGTVWIGGYPDEERVNNMNHLLNVPEGYKAFALVGVGYPENKDSIRFIDRANNAKIHFEKM